MPTADRREFIPRAIRCFAAQTYPNLELIILDNGIDPVYTTAVLDGLSSDHVDLHGLKSIRYVEQGGEKLNHGQLMNIACERAHGEFCIVTDDDDFYAPDRVFRQIAPLLAVPGYVGTGLKNLMYYDKAKQQAWRYSDPTNTWLGAIAFRKSAWEAKRFAEIPAGADLEFQRHYNDPARLYPKKFIPVHGDAIACAIHATNAGSVGTKVANHPKQFTPIDYQEVVKFTGGDL